MKIPILEESNSSNRKESYIKKHYPEFYKFLNNKYSHIDNYKDRISVFLHGLEDVPKCPVCGRNVKYKGFKRGYNTYCSKQCSNSYDIKIQKAKATNIERYGVSSYMQTDECKIRIKNTCLERYGTISFTQSDIFKEKSKATCLEKYGDENYKNLEKARITKLERYGDMNYNNREKNKVTCLERYGNENYNNTEKNYNSKKRNNTFNSSNIEELFNDYLIVNNIEFKRQYKSDLYPFYCDFYIPSEDLYIEIQASWTHGEHPFNENDIDDIKKLELWQSKGTDYYNNAIYVWTVRDPLKRETAKKNGVRLLEVFSNDIKELISIFERYFKE